MRKERRRINITLERADYEQAERLALAGGFKNVCAFARALLTQVAQYAARRKMSAQERARQPTPIAEEINEMFAELIDWDAASPAQKKADILNNDLHENR